MKFLRHLPIETYILIVPAVLFLSIISFLYLSCGGSESACYASILEGNILSILLDYSGVIIGVFFIALLIVGVIKYFLLHTDDLETRAQVYKLRSIIFITFSVYLLLFALVFAIQIMFHTVDPARSFQVSESLMHIDKDIFGVYVPFMLNQFITSKVVSDLILISYMGLQYVFFGLIIFAMLRSIIVLRKLLFAIFVACVIGIPFWIFIPAIAPDSMYRLNIFNKEVPSGIHEVVSETKFLPNTERVFKSLEDFWIDKRGESIGTTTFPSMHAAWGVIMTLAALELWAPLLFFMLPWLIFELIGTMYTLQHYAVDTIFGIIIGLLAYFIVHLLLKYEKKYFVDKYHLIS